MLVVFEEKISLKIFVSGKIYVSGRFNLYLTIVHLLTYNEKKPQYVSFIPSFKINDERQKYQGTMSFRLKVNNVEKLFFHCWTFSGSLRYFLLAQFCTSCQLMQHSTVKCI